MICPNISNKQVVKDFNEIVEALGGKPLTIEEFKNAELRNQRTGKDYTAMESAYKIWHYNRDAMDYAPNGAQSKLFQDLLKLTNGDRARAIRLKSRIYSQKFLSDFSKKKKIGETADINGEPVLNLVVTLKNNKALVKYYGPTMGKTTAAKTNKNLIDFDDIARQPIKELAESKGVSVRELKMSDSQDYKDLLIRLITEWRNNPNNFGKTLVVSNKILSKENIFDNTPSIPSEAAFVKRQAERSEDFNEENRERLEAEALQYYNDLLKYNPGLKIDDRFVSEIESQSKTSTQRTTPVEFAKGDIESILNNDTLDMMSDGHKISSDELVLSLIEKGIVDADNLVLANILNKHDIPVLIDNNMPNDKIATTITDKDGNSVITINPSAMRSVTMRYASTAILHELVHAVTVDAIDNPKTSSDYKFSESTKKVFKTFKKIVSKNPIILSDVESGMYAFTNEREFAAVFITDSNVRSLVYQIAKESDNSYSARLKKFINNIVSLFVKKQLFNTNENTLKQYENEFRNYLENKSAISVNPNSDIAQLIRQYNSFDRELLENESILEFFKRFDKFKQSLRENALRIGPINISKNKSGNSYEYQEVVNMLNTRMKALRASSKKDIVDKDRLILENAQQIEMFSNRFTSKYNAISELVKIVTPQILHDTDELRRKYNGGQYISGEEYMYQAHANIGMFSNLTRALMTILEDADNVASIINHHNQNQQESEKITVEDIVTLKNLVKNLNSVCVEGDAVVSKVLQKISIQSLTKVRNEVGASDIDPYLNRLASGEPIIDDDVSWFELYGGAADSSSSPVVRSLAYILGKAKDQAEHESLEAMSDILDAAKGLTLSKIYEKTKSGFSGYLIRRLNYGQFYQDYDNEMIRINRKISKKYHIVLSDDNRIAPQLEEARVEWHMLRNDWLDKHALRRYNKQYYDAWSKVPDIARQAVNSYNSEISAIVNNPAYVEDGIVRYEKMDDATWDRLQHLIILKKLLWSEYDLFGNKKEEGTEAYDIYKALHQLDADLNRVDENGARKQPKRNIKLWKETRDRIIEECGGAEKYQAYQRGEKNHGFNEEKFERWESRNTIKTLKRDKLTGEVLVFKKIDEEMRGINVSDMYGPEYKRLQEQANELLRPFKDQANDVIAEELSESTKGYLLEIYAKMNEIRRNAAKNNKQLEILSQRYKQIFEQYLKREDTPYLQKIKNDIINTLIDDFGAYDDQLMMLMLSDYGYDIIDYDTGDIIDVQPYKWLTKLVAIDEQYMDIQPGNAWIEHEEDDRYLNKEFLLQSQQDGNQNVSMIPKSQYINRDYDKLMSDSRYRRLHKETLKLIKKANEKQTNRQYTDDYLLPQISGTLLNRMRNTPKGKYRISVFFKWLLEKLGLSRDANEDSILGTTYAADASENELDQIFDKHQNNLRGKYPDGRSFNIVPQYYTRRMKDPSIISTDLLDILHKYYLMSASYEQKTKVRGECDALLDMLQNKAFRETSDNTVIGGKNTYESKTYKSARKFLEMNLYNIRRTQASFKKLGITFEYTKALELWKEYATARNLGANPKVAVVGTLTSTYVHMINQLVGSMPGVHDKYDMKIGCAAFREMLLRFTARSGFGLTYLSNPRSNDKLMLLMEECDLTNQMERKFMYSDRNRGFGAISKNYVYGYLTLGDFFIKSQIMISEFMSYRYVDGEFITKSDLYYDRKQLGESAFKEKLRKFKKAKSLYSVLKANNGKLTCDPEYKKAWEKIRYQAKSRAQKTAENADGMATTLQRNALTQNIIGALVQMHRQYLPLMMQEAYGKQVMDYDTQRYKNAQLRTLWNVTTDLMCGNLLAGMIAGGFGGFALGGPLGSILGIGAAIPVRTAYKIRHSKAQQKQMEYKKVLKKYFSDFETRDSSHKSYANRAAIAKTIIEVLLFNMIMQPAITALCKYYDDDDSTLIQFLLYCLRAFAWESYTKYRTAELFNNIKSATGASSVTDGLVEFFSDTSEIVARTIADPRNNAIEPLTGAADTEFSILGDEVQSGAYEGWRKIYKTAAKLTPWHNTWEQAMDPKAKRKYNELQIQKLPESER